MRRSIASVALALAAVASAAAAPPGAAGRARRRAAPARPAEETSPSRRLPPRLRKLIRTHKVDDQRLRRQFDQAVEFLIELQRRDLEVDVDLRRQIKRRRTQRRRPSGGPRDLHNLEPAHIPSVQVLRSPLT